MRVPARILICLAVWLLVTWVSLLAVVFLLAGIDDIVGVVLIGLAAIPAILVYRRLADS